MKNSHLYSNGLLGVSSRAFGECA